MASTASTNSRVCECGVTFSAASTTGTKISIQSNGVSRISLIRDFMTVAVSIADDGGKSGPGAGGALIWLNTGAASAAGKSRAAANFSPSRFAQLDLGTRPSSLLGRKNFDAADRIRAQPACARCHCAPELLCGARAGESRRGQIGAKIVCRELCGLSSQREGACERSLQPFALSLFAEALCQQFVLGLDADVVSGVGRCRQARADTRSRGCACAAVLDLDGRLLAAATGVDSEPLIADHSCRPRLSRGCATKIPWPRLFLDVSPRTIRG